MGFVQSNTYGKSGEKLVLALLNKNGYSATLNEDKEKRAFYDIIVQLSPKKKIYVESKFDMMCCQTGNVCIEYHNCLKDKPSGINITKAHIYSYTILDMGNPTVWFANVAKLKNFLNTVTPFKTINKGGDGNASLYLYKYEIILDAVFERMENLQDEAAFKDAMNRLLKKDKE